MSQGLTDNWLREAATVKKSAKVDRGGGTPVEGGVGVNKALNPYL